MEFRSTKIDNGLEIVAECNPRAYSMAMAFFVKTGARDETDKVAGVSHFLEHMAFKGTATRSGDELNRQLDEIGSHANAYTSEEQTVYFASFLPEYQDRALELLSDMMRPALRDDDFDTEKKVIIEEIYKYEDQPPFGAAEKCMAAHFDGHPLGRNILGTVESVGGLSPQSMRQYFRQRYSPSNMLLVAAGRLDYDHLVDTAIKRCGDWENFSTERMTAPGPPSKGFNLVHKPSASQQYVVQIAPGPAAEDDVRYAARLLATVLGDDSGSRLYWDLIETGRAECASIGTYEFEGAGIFMTYLCCSPADATENLQRIYRVLRDAEQHGITENELSLAKSKTCANIVLASERPSNRLFSVGGRWVQRAEYRTTKQTVDTYQAVTLSDVEAVLEKYALTRNTTVAVGPLSELASPS